jgi:hypothetical protein
MSKQPSKEEHTRKEQVKGLATAAGNRSARIIEPFRWRLRRYSRTSGSWTTCRLAMAAELAYRLRGNQEQ